MKTLMTHLVALALMGLVLGGNVAQAGDLHFTEFGRYAVADPHPPAAGDMNNDGNIDLVVPGYDNDITVMLGDGTGALNSGMIVSQGGYREVTAVVGYFDGDANLDAAITNNDAASFSSMLGDGTGYLSEFASYSAGSYPHAITKGYFNEVHDPSFQSPGVDLATISWLGNKLTVFISQGDGSFSPTVYPLGTGLNGVASGDFNGDGMQDLICSKVAPGQIAQFWGNGDGTFTQGVDVPAGGSPGGMAAGDFNNDGVQDALVYVYMGGGVNQASVYMGQLAGNLQWNQSLPNLQGPHMGPALADFDGDGDLDLASKRDADTFVALRGVGDGTFVEDWVRVFSDSPGVRQVTAADLNNDGNVDLAVSLGDTQEIAVFLGNLPELPGDLNGDGFVGHADLDMVLDRWGTYVLPTHVTQDLTVATSTDWMASQLLVTLDSGEVYQNMAGGVGPSNAILWPLFPGLEFATHIDPPNIAGGALDLVGGPTGVQFDESGINIAWYNTETDDVGAVNVARVTLSEDAAGEWQFLASSNGQDWLVINDGTIADGVMTPEVAGSPTLGLLVVLDNSNAADPSGDGFVSQPDLDLVLTNWGQGTPPGAPVPEPATLWLLGLSGLALVRRRRPPAE